MLAPVTSAFPHRPRLSGTWPVLVSYPVAHWSWPLTGCPARTAGGSQVDRVEHFAIRTRDDMVHLGRASLALRPLIWQRQPPRMRTYRQRRLLRLGPEEPISRHRTIWAQSVPPARFCSIWAYRKDNRYCVRGGRGPDTQKSAFRTLENVRQRRRPRILNTQVSQLTWLGCDPPALRWQGNRRLSLLSGHGVGRRVEYRATSGR
jgi:hypothetical protein